jgi:hypothetical protein
MMKRVDEKGNGNSNFKIFPPSTVSLIFNRQYTIVRTPTSKRNKKGQICHGGGGGSAVYLWPFTKCKKRL